MNWGIEDVIAAIGLVTFFLIAYRFLVARPQFRKKRLIIGFILAFVLLAIWIELAVGIFD